MVRAPCCESMGLKKGPWTQEEDEILAAYITRCGHGNWRALPKQAGLLRCGKSCRLRWTNYLRPDIKRGDYSKEEEETIINLHEMLGNRWSIIASRLPGRTDNEIKNVWHTHLKKRLNPNHVVNEPKRTKTKTKPMTLELDPNQGFENPGFANVSPLRSYIEASSSGTDSSAVTEENSNVEVKETISSFEEISDIDDSFWSDVLSMGNCAAPMDFTTSESFPCSEINDPLSSSSSSDDVMDFWLRIFMQTGDPKELPGI